MAYTVISPAKGCDGNWYVDASGGPNFDGYHLSFERDRGNLFAVERIAIVNEENEIPDGAFACMTAWGASLWRYVDMPVKAA